MIARAGQAFVVLLAAAVAFCPGPSRAQHAPAKQRAAQATKDAAVRAQSAPSKPAPPGGASYDYAYDGKDVAHPERAWLGRAFVHAAAAGDPGKPLPLLVFVHGLNAELVKHRWMGGGREGDVRRVVSGLIETGKAAPMLVAAPSTVVSRAATVAITSWPGFDLDAFVEKTAERLKGLASIDRDRVVVAGHSGGGCNASGGIASAAHAQRVHAVLAIDTCMLPEVADRLARARPATHVVVSWQMLSWQKRPIPDFRKRWEAALAASPAANADVLRVLEELRPSEPMPHDAMVHLVLERWLPKLVPAVVP